MTTKNFIFGYGSLISKESREKTGISKESYIATLKEFQRTWNVKIKEAKATALGIIKNKKYSCNGILFEIPEKELENFDKREKKYYSRIEIDPKLLKIQNFPNIQNIKIWTYATKTPEKPTKNFPILLSYIDVILKGCLDTGENFTEEFIKTTDGWEFMLNDRKNPKYPRAISNAPIDKIDKIDKIII